MIEMEVSPYEEMANPQGIQVFAVEIHGFQKIFCIFGLCVECNHRHLYLRRVSGLSGVRYYSGRHRKRFCASGLRSPELSAQVRRSNSCTSSKPARMDASIMRTSRNDRVCVEDGRGQRARALFVVWM